MAVEPVASIQALAKARSGPRVPRAREGRDSQEEYNELSVEVSIHAPGAAWRWGMDTVIPMRTRETQGEGKDRRDCMRQFRAAWDRFAADEANLVEFLNAKRKRR